MRKEEGGEKEWGIEREQKRVSFLLGPSVCPPPSPSLSPNATQRRKRSRSRTEQQPSFPFILYAQCVVSFQSAAPSFILSVRWERGGRGEARGGGGVHWVCPGRAVEGEKAGGRRRRSDLTGTGRVNGGERKRGLLRFRPRREREREKPPNGRRRERAGGRRRRSEKRPSLPLLVGGLGKIENESRRARGPASGEESGRTEHTVSGGRAGRRESTLCTRGASGSKGRGGERERDNNISCFSEAAATAKGKRVKEKARAATQKRKVV